MKTHLVILIVSLFNLTTGYTQTKVYHPFPEDSATWVVDNTSNLCMGYCNSEIYKMSGDTIINGISYNKIYHRSLKFYYASIPPNPVVGYKNLSPVDYWGGVRQDILHKKVYIRKPSMNSDTLLYDFNLKIGDTLPPSYLQNGLNQKPSIVTGFDSIRIDGQYHKKFIFNNNSNTGYAVNTLVEGVGSCGRLDLIYDIFEAGPSTACFNGNIITGEAFGKECFVNAYTVPVFEHDRKNVFEIFPNPFSSQTVLHINALPENATLTIYNSFGQQVKQLTNISEQTITLSRDNLPGGLYFLRLIEGNKIFVDKIVITD